MGNVSGSGERGKIALASIPRLRRKEVRVRIFFYSTNSLNKVGEGSKRVKKRKGEEKGP